MLGCGVMGRKDSGALDQVFPFTKALIDQANGMEKSNVVMGTFDLI